MKNKASVWLVLSFLILSLGIVYALTTSPSPKTGGSPITSTQTAGAADSRTLATEPVNPNAGFDLTKVDGYTLLDPPPVGVAAPNFTAKTAEGKTIHLSGYKGKKNVVLIFYQGSFCSHCGAQLSNVQKHLSDFKKQDAEIIAISGDDEAHAMQSVGERGLTFTVVPDTKLDIIHQYHIANANKGGKIAWPSAFVVDKKGIVRLSYADREGNRLHSSDLLPVLSKITGKPAPKLTYDE